MANFGVRVAYPAPTARPAVTAARARGLVGRLVRTVLKLIDDAPFDLGWPPSPRQAARMAAWRMPPAPAEERDPADNPAADAPPRRRAA